MLKNRNVKISNHLGVMSGRTLYTVNSGFKTADLPINHSLYNQTIRLLKHDDWMNKWIHNIIYLHGKLCHSFSLHRIFFSFLFLHSLILTFFTYILAFNGKHESLHGFRNLQQKLVGKRTKWIGWRDWLAVHPKYRKWELLTSFNLPRTSLLLPSNFQRYTQRISAVQNK